MIRSLGRTLTGALLIAGCSDPPVLPQPNVVIISIDTLRYDHLSANTPDSPSKTPNMDRLVRDGVRFTQAWSPISATGPAFASVMTGKSVQNHGVMMDPFKGGSALDPSHLTLAEQLKKAGYRTGAFVSGFTLRKDVGLDQGFDIYDAPTEKYRRWSKKTVERMASWLAESDKPTMVWFHSFDTHGPLKRWTLPDEDTREWKRSAQSRVSPHQQIEDIVDPAYYKAKYALAVEYADEQVGTILADLETGYRYDDTLIILTADHGVGFSERNLWFEHGSNAYAEQLHIPLVVKLPKNAQAGTTREAMVSLMDIVPTVRSFLELPVLTDIDGKNLLTETHAQLDGESSHCKPLHFLKCSPRGGAGKVLASRTNAETLLRQSTTLGAIYERYSRHSDPGERSSHLVELRPLDSPVPPLGPAALTQPLEELRLHRAAATYAPLPSTAPPDEPDAKADEAGALDNEVQPEPVDPETQRKLEALGYVQ